MEGVIISEWAKVIYGMVFSLAAGYILGFVLVKFIEFAFWRVNRRAGNQICVALISTTG